MCIVIMNKMKQPLGQGKDIILGFQQLSSRDAARNLLEIGVFDFQSQCLSFEIPLFDTRRKLKNQVVKFYQ